MPEYHLAALGNKVLCKSDIVLDYDPSNFTSSIGSTFGLQSEIGLSSGACSIKKYNGSFIRRDIVDIHVKLSLTKLYLERFRASIPLLVKKVPQLT